MTVVTLLTAKLVGFCLLSSIFFVLSLPYVTIPGHPS